MAVLLKDLRYMLRQLQKSPGFTAIAVLTLALGIGATVALFSVVEGILLRPLPFHSPDELVVVGDHIQGTAPSVTPAVTAPEIRSYMRDTRAFQGIGGYCTTSYELSGLADSVHLNGARLSGTVFSVLGVRAMLGRVFTEQEDENRQQVAVLSYSLWRDRFHGDPGVLGRSILLDRRPYVVIGVMPSNFEFPLIPGHLTQSELWVPLSLPAGELTNDAANWSFRVVARLKPGVSAVEAQSDADRVAHDIMRDYPPFMSHIHINSVVRPLKETTVSQARSLVRILFLCVLVLLLIACANLAGMLLVRAIRRARENAIRLALGASAPALLRQTILESLVLSCSGGVLGLILAAIALRLGVSLLPETLPRLNEVTLDWRVIAFAFLLTLAVGVLCGVLPGLTAFRTNLNEALREGGRTGTSGGSQSRLQSALVAIEISAALVLLAASGLLLRSFEKIRSTDLGFLPAHVTIAAYSLPPEHYGTRSSVMEFGHQVLDRLQPLPGTKDVAITTNLPMSGVPNVVAFVVAGYVPPNNANMNLATMSCVMGDYFRALAIPLIRGRYFSPSDNDRDQLVAIVNEKLADHYWPGQNPLGKRLRMGTTELHTRWLTVVGEVANVKEKSPDTPTQAQFYQPLEQFNASVGDYGSATDTNGGDGYIVLRSTLPPEQVIDTLRSTIRALDPQLAFTHIETMQDAVSDSEAPRRFNTFVITSFASAAVFLTALGIYSVIAFTIAARAQEMAIRMALGAQRSGILRLVVGYGLRLAIIGCAIGLVGAVAMGRFIRSFLFSVNTVDPLVLTVSAICIVCLALAASAIPAIRAASIDPLVALKSD